MSAWAMMAGSFAFLFLFIAAVSLPHKMMGYKRADLLTLLSFAALTGLAILIDPLHDVVGKDSLYVIIAGGASLLTYAGLKIEEKSGHVVFALIAAPSLGAFLAPMLFVLAVAADETDYVPPKPPPRIIVRAVHALARRAKPHPAP